MDEVVENFLRTKTDTTLYAYPLCVRSTSRAECISTSHFFENAGIKSICPNTQSIMWPSPSTCKVALLCLVIYLVAAVTWVESAYRRCHWQSTTGTVRDAKFHQRWYGRRRSSQQKCYTFDIEYYANGSDYVTFTSPCFSTARCAKGESVDLLHKKQDPVRKVQLKSRLKLRLVGR